MCIATARQTRQELVCVHAVNTNYGVLDHLWSGVVLLLTFATPDEGAKIDRMIRDWEAIARDPSLRLRVNPWGEGQILVQLLQFNPLKRAMARVDDCTDETGMVSTVLQAVMDAEERGVSAYQREAADFVRGLTIEQQREADRREVEALQVGEAA